MNTHQIVVSGHDHEGFAHLLPFKVLAENMTWAGELASREAIRLEIQSITVFRKEDPVPPAFWSLFDWKEAPSLTSQPALN